MLCPRCHDSFLDEIQREGVVVDVCRKCRGVWLDRGELEKLRAAERHEVMDAQPMRFEVRRPYRDHDDDDDRRYHPRRKKGLVDLLGDLID